MSQAFWSRYREEKKSKRALYYHNQEMGEVLLPKKMGKVTPAMSTLTTQFGSAVVDDLSSCKDHHSDETEPLVSAKIGEFDKGKEEGKQPLDKNAKLITFHILKPKRKVISKP